MLTTMYASPTIPEAALVADLRNFQRGARLQFEGMLDATTAGTFVARIREHLAAGVTPVIDIDKLQVVDDPWCCSVRASTGRSRRPGCRRHLEPQPR